MDLTNLDTYYFSIIQFDINNCNLYVKERREQLRNQDKISQDMLVNLLKAFERVPDQVFHNWLIRKKENYEEGANITPDSLMLEVLNCYQSFKAKDKWKNTSPKDKSIIMLTTQIQQMHHLLQCTDMRRNSNSNETKNATNAKQNNQKRQHEKRNKPSKSRKESDMWKKIPPKDGELKQKIWRDK